MGARRTEKISTVLTPELAARLNDYATRRRWSLSTAIAALIEEGLNADGPTVEADKFPFTSAGDPLESSLRYHQHALYKLRSREIREPQMKQRTADEATDAPA